MNGVLTRREKPRHTEKTQKQVGLVVTEAEIGVVRPQGKNQRKAGDHQKPAEAGRTLPLCLQREHGPPST